MKKSFQKKILVIFFFIHFSYSYSCHVFVLFLILIHIFYFKFNWLFTKKISVITQILIAFEILLKFTLQCAHVLIFLFFFLNKKRTTRRIRRKKNQQKYNEMKKWCYIFLFLFYFCLIFTFTFIICSIYFKIYCCKFIPPPPFNCHFYFCSEETEFKFIYLSVLNLFVFNCSK